MKDSYEPIENQVALFFKGVVRRIRAALAAFAKPAQSVALVAPDQPEPFKPRVLPMDAMFEDKRTIKVPVGGGNYVDMVATGKDSNGDIIVRPKTPAGLVRRSKPNGVSASTGAGAYGITNVTSRLSQDVDSFGAGFEPFVVFSRNSYWRQFALAEDFSIGALQKVPLDKIGELLATVSPEVSNGLYIRTIFSNSGYEIRALKMDADEIDEAAQAELDAMRKITARQNGTEDVFFNRMFNTYFMRGAVLSELVLDERGREFAGIVTPDPKSLVFRRSAHPLLGTKWDFGQMQNGQFVSLDIETIRYVPLNPFTDSIEGNSIITSSFFVAVFLMAVLRDFKRVIQQQGYPRYDISVDLSKLENVMPTEARDESPEGEQAFQDWAKTLFASIRTYINNLKPDETFVHYEGVTVNPPVGALSTNSLTSIDGLFKGLERMAARALKVPPIFMGITDGVSEANSNRQFEAFVKDIENGQHAIENSIGELYQLALLAKGKLCRVEVRFAQMRSSERLRDAQADLTEAEYAKFQYEMGWISQDAAAKLGAGVEKSDQPEPRIPLGAVAAPVTTTPQDNGVNRSLKWTKLRTPTVGEIDQAKKLFADLAGDPLDELITANIENN